MPRPRSKTSVLAVPRSTARSRCPKAPHTLPGARNRSVARRRPWRLYRGTVPVRAPSESYAHVPELWEEAAGEGLLEVRHPGRAAGAGAGADLARGHQHVVGAPQGDALV